MVGVAAHITAAAEHGPRYDRDLSPSERSSESNGIWMCQTHGKQVDDNASRHTVEELRRWKKRHEDWVFSRVANADSLLQHGVSSIAVENIGPFRTRSSLKLGRHNVLYGANGVGKSTLCEAIAAFSGGMNFEDFCRRWKPFGPRSPSLMIEASVAVKGAKTTVRISEEPIGLKRVPKTRHRRMHVEVNGNVSPHWPKSLFNVVFVDSQVFRPRRIRDPFRRALRALAPQLGMTEDWIWDSLRDEFFCSSALGFRIRRIGLYKAEVLVPGQTDYRPTAALGGGEHTFILFDILLRLIRTDPRPTPWLIIIDSNLFLGLDRDNKKLLIDTIIGLDDFELQTIVCVNYENDAIELKAATDDKWIGSSTIGGMTVHSFL